LKQVFVELRDLFWLILILFILLQWWQGLKMKELALRHVKRYCASMDLQLLDESIALRGFWLKRGDDGRVHIWRSYLFEFTSTGDERYQGKIILLGHRVTTLQVDPHRFE